MTLSSIFFLISPYLFSQVYIVVNKFHVDNMTGSAVIETFIYKRFYQKSGNLKGAYRNWSNTQRLEEVRYKKFGKGVSND